MNAPAEVRFGWFTYVLERAGVGLTVFPPRPFKLFAFLLVFRGFAYTNPTLSPNEPHVLINR